MRLTLHLEDDLVADAEAYTGIHDKLRLVHAAIVALIEREAAIRLARLGGTEPRLTGKPRRQLPKKRVSGSGSGGDVTIERSTPVP